MTRHSEGSFRASILPASILVVDDEPAARSGLKTLLEQEGYEVSAAEDGMAALELAAQKPFDLVITDLRMPKMDGLMLTAKLQELDDSIPIVVVSAYGEIHTAVSAIRQGADDFLTKPIDLDMLLITLHRVLDKRNLKLEKKSLEMQLREQEGTGLRGVLGGSEAMLHLLQDARRVAPSRASVMILGESGTGKGELARAIHQLSPRKDKPFVEVQCAALAENLLESELFGHERGAFTSADRRRIGRFEQAQGGTIFLDEVGEIPLSLQVKLLRVLQERRFERVGGNETLECDVRVIAATHRSLSQDVESGRFRADLFYRLNVVNLEMPRLRDRGFDVLVLAEHFLRKSNEENGRKIKGFTDAARLALLAYPYPGNVRELANAIERSVIFATGARVDVRDLPEEFWPPEMRTKTQRRMDEMPPVPGSSLAQLERYAIVRTLQAAENKTRAAEILGISVRTLQYRLQEYQATPSDE